MNGKMNEKYTVKTIPFSLVRDNGNDNGNCINGHDSFYFGDAHAAHALCL